MSATQKAKAKERLSDQGMGYSPLNWDWNYLPLLSLLATEVQVTYTQFQNELQTIASKIGELESEAEEHECVEFAYLIWSIALMYGTLFVQTCPHEFDRDPGGRSDT